MNLKVNKVNVDKAFLVNKYLPANYADAFECVAPISNQITPDHLQIAFWGSEKSWIKTLFKLRDLLVKPFGLKTSRNKGTGSIAACIENGNSHHIASVSDRFPKETILLLDDRHLKAYISISIAEVETEADLKRVTVCTIVHFNNWFGYLYFHAKYPLHSIPLFDKMLQSSY